MALHSHGFAAMTELLPEPTSSASLLSTLTFSSVRSRVMDDPSLL